MSSSSRVQPSPFSQFFIASQLIGAILLCVLVGTVVLSRHIHRNVTWTNLCIAWIISALSYCILAFAGQQNGPPPSHTLCFAQAVLLYGAPTVTTCSGFTLIIQLYFDLTSALIGVKSADPIRNTVLCVIPYIAYVVVMVGAIAYGHHRPVSRTEIDTYCHFTSGSYGSFVAVAVVIILLVNICVLAYLSVRLYRHSRGSKNIEDLRPVIRGIIRISMLKLALMFPIIVSIVFLGNEQHRHAFDSMIAIMPLVSFIILGLQPDVLRIWFRRHHSDSLPSVLQESRPQEVKDGIKKDMA